MKKLLLGVSIVALFFGSCQKPEFAQQNRLQTQPIDIPNENELNTIKRNYSRSTTTQLPKEIYNTNPNVLFNKAEFLDMINSIRAQGAFCSPPAPPLKLNHYLEQASMEHAKDMALHNFVGHSGSGSETDPAKKAPGIGSNFMDRIIFFGYPVKGYDLVGEVAAITKDKKRKIPINKHLKKAINLYLKDSAHCKIFMNSRFKDVGIGVYKKGKNYYWVMDFGETEKQRNRLH